MTCLAWNSVPALSELALAAETHGRPLYLAVCLPDMRMPEFAPCACPSGQEILLAENIRSGLACLQFTGVNVFADVLPDVHLWLFPPQYAGRLNAHFPQGIDWQTEAVPQESPHPVKPWFRPSENPENRKPPQHVLVVGAGIAGAATAYSLARHGVRVTVLDAGGIAGAASGNYQGLLYAKISPHPTEQTELLLAGYGHTRRLLQKLLPDQNAWGGQGVLHLNFSEAERKRNQALAQQTHHAHLYRAVSAREAAEIASIDVFSDGLYWPQGIWLNPRALIEKLLSHPLIEVRPHTPLLRAERNGRQWLAHTPKQIFAADCIVYCTGADSANAPEPNLAALPLRLMRGQTSVAAATQFSHRLRCALSGESYVSPAWQGMHCYGASFVLNCGDSAWRPSEETANRNALAALNPPLAESLFALSDGLSESATTAAEKSEKIRPDNNPESSGQRIRPAEGHAAVRCDSTDHLPVVGALGNAAAMRQTYAKLASDKNYPIDTPCPYLPDAYANTAHGTRGLATAPICAEALAAEILGLPNPFPPHIRQALHPNRLIIRDIVRSHTPSPPQCGISDTD
ncbi:FAD-dependent 5-carboxymethylaminomethyl-2-thiouridine(34) oxidoreductase MnmC [Neisseria sp.]|uniref:FAD-dependent 5-carboxymethylaminomethyl-2-thiouridine(34) oxidoreductase MnmC n=1 Tax=Neisseria sp. TaxID=192066 RepID=UPI0035A1BDF8